MKKNNNFTEAQSAESLLQEISLKEIPLNEMPLKERHLIEKQLKETYISWNAINGLYAVWAKKMNLTSHSLFTLYAIYNDRENCTLSKICEEWFMPKQTVSSILKDLEQKGYIFYLASPKDKRNKIIQLTESGVEYAKSILDELFKVEVTVLKKMGRQSRQHMIEGNNLFFELLKNEMSEEK